MEGYCREGQDSIRVVAPQKKKKKTGNSFMQTFTQISSDPELSQRVAGSIPTASIIRQFHSPYTHSQTTFGFNAWERKLFLSASVTLSSSFSFLRALFSFRLLSKHINFKTQEIIIPFLYVWNSLSYYKGRTKCLKVSQDNIKIAVFLDAFRRAVLSALKEGTERTAVSMY